MSEISVSDLRLWGVGYDPNAISLAFVTRNNDTTVRLHLVWLWLEVTGWHRWQIGTHTDRIC